MMKKRLALITVIIFAVFSYAYYEAAVQSKRFNPPTIQSQNFSEIKPQNIRAVAFGVSGKVSDFAPAAPDDGESGKRSAFGSLIAKIADNDSLEMRYQHLNKKGELMTGKCFSTPETLSDGRIRLREKWCWTSGDFSEGESIVEEIKG